MRVTLSAAFRWAQQPTTGQEERTYLWLLGGPTLGRVALKQAVLLDLYDTALTCDFALHDVELPRIAGVERGRWSARTRELATPIMDGSITLAAAFADVVAFAGDSASPELVQTLVRRDQELLLQEAVLYPDTIPFLQRVRARGIKTALISNCAENTLALVDHLALTPLVDEVVLLCEVGHAKPAPEIYQLALARLGVAPSDALLIDDQQKYCDGAKSLGMAVLRIDRGAGRAEAGVVTSLSQVEGLLDQ